MTLTVVENHPGEVALYIALCDKCGWNSEFPRSQALARDALDLHQIACTGEGGRCTCGDNGICTFCVLESFRHENLDLVESERIPTTREHR